VHQVISKGQVDPLPLESNQYSVLTFVFWLAIAQMEEHNLFHRLIRFSTYWHSELGAENLQVAKLGYIQGKSML
jgi:hypothetical protein